MPASRLSSVALHSLSSLVGAILSVLGEFLFKRREIIGPGEGALDADANALLGAVLNGGDIGGLPLP